MVITIVGCGALGSLLAARLIAGGARVQILQRLGPQLDALRTRGIRIKDDPEAIASTVGSIVSWQPEAISNDTGELAPSDLLLILVKTTETHQLKNISKLLTDRGVVLTLQNGLGNAERLAKFVPSNQIAVGTDTYGAYRIESGLIGWGGDGQILLGAWQADGNHEWVAQALQKHGLNCQYTITPLTALWKKLGMNLMANLCTALTGVRNGQLRDYAALMNVLRQLAAEITTAAARAHVALNLDDLWQSLQATLAATANNKSSMLQDIEAGRTTEVAAITTPVLSLAKEDYEFPITRTLDALIRAKTNHPQEG